MSNDPATNHSDSPSQPSPDERRATVRARSHWTRSHHDGPCPTITDLHLSGNNEIGSHYFLLRVDPNPRHSVFIMCGDAVKADLGGRLVGTTLWDCTPEEIRDDLCQACGKALDGNAPVNQDGAYSPGDGTKVRYRSVFMPVRSDLDRHPSYAFGAFGSKQLAA